MDYILLVTSEYYLKIKKQSLALFINTLIHIKVDTAEGSLIDGGKSTRVRSNVSSFFSISTPNPFF